MQNYIRPLIVTLILMITSSFMVVAQDNTVLVWTTFSDDALEWLNTQADAFNETNPDFMIEVQAFDSDSSLITSYSNNESTEPALLHLTDEYTQVISDMQVTQSFADVIGDAETILDVPVHQVDWFDAVKAHASVNNTWTMIPVFSSTAMTYVNVDLLEELGAGMAFVPQDWVTLDAICAELQSAVEDGTLTSCVTWDDTAWLYEHWVAQQNTPLTNNENGRDIRATDFNLLTDASVATTEFMQYLAQFGFVNDPSGDELISIAQFEDGQSPILFADNTVGLTLETAFSADVLASNSDFGWSGARLDTENLWLTAFIEPEIAEAATAFALFLTSPENNVEWHQATGSLPLTQSAVDMLTDSDWAETHPEQINIFRVLSESIAESPTLYAVFGDAEAIRDNLRFGLNSIILNDIDVTEGLETTQDFILEGLELYNLGNAPDID